MIRPARAGRWVLALSAVAIGAVVVWVRPLSPWILVVLLAAYAAYSIGGVLVPQSQMYGDVWWRGDPSSRAVALTFDDGPNPTTTPRVLEILEAWNARATFFVLGSKVERHPETLRAIAAAGHEIALHGQRHDRLHALRSPETVARELERAKITIERVAGTRLRWFRPPLGHVSPRTSKAASMVGLTLVAWTIRGLDGLRTARAERVASRIIRRLRPGAIVLMHDAAERDDFTPASLVALPLVLRELDERGLRAVSLGQLRDG